MLADGRLDDVAGLLAQVRAAARDQRLAILAQPPVPGTGTGIAWVAVFAVGFGFDRLGTCLIGHAAEVIWAEPGGDGSMGAEVFSTREPLTQISFQLHLHTNGLEGKPRRTQGRGDCRYSEMAESFKFPVTLAIISV